MSYFNDQFQDNVGAYAQIVAQRQTSNAVKEMTELQREQLNLLRENRGLAPVLSMAELSAIGEMTHGWVARLVKARNKALRAQAPVTGRIIKVRRAATVGRIQITREGDGCILWINRGQGYIPTSEVYPFPEPGQEDEAIDYWRNVWKATV